MDPKSVWSRTFSHEGSHMDLPHCCGRGSTWVCNLGQLGVCAWFHSLLLPSWNLEWFLNKGSRISILHWTHRLCIRSWAAQMELFKNKRPDPPVGVGSLETVNFGGDLTSRQDLKFSDWQIPCNSFCSTSEELSPLRWRGKQSMKCPEIGNFQQ